MLGLGSPQVVQQKFTELQHAVEAGTDRFNKVDQMATNLIDQKNPYSTEVLDCQEHLRSRWQDLLGHMDGRAQKLNGAAEIHRFNRDVEDALSRIQEKYSSIPEDLGRDLKAAKTYMIKHEGFENELVALEAQVKTLTSQGCHATLECSLESFGGGVLRHAYFTPLCLLLAAASASG